MIIGYRLYLVRIDFCNDFEDDFIDNMSLTQINQNVILNNFLFLSRECLLESYDSQNQKQIEFFT